MHWNTRPSRVWSQCTELSYSRQVIRLFKAQLELLLLFSYLLVSTFSINLSKFLDLYAESQEFLPAQGLFIFKKKSVTTT